jgi:hypothetical protein
MKGRWVGGRPSARPRRRRQEQPACRDGALVAGRGLGGGLAQGEISPDGHPGARWRGVCGPQRGACMAAASGGAGSPPRCSAPTWTGRSDSICCRGGRSARCRSCSCSTTSRTTWRRESWRTQRQRRLSERAAGRSAVAVGAAPRQEPARRHLPLPDRAAARRRVRVSGRCTGARRCPRGERCGRGDRLAAIRIHRNQEAKYPETPGNGGRRAGSARGIERKLEEGGWRDTG